MGNEKKMVPGDDHAASTHGYPLEERLETFAAEQKKLLQEMIGKIVEDAIAGADTEEEELYCEIGYDSIERRLSPLDDMGSRLTLEKMVELIDAHPAVNYSDMHNTGKTIYLNEPEILQELGLLSNKGLSDLAQL
jgi:hypothetical protein